MRKLIIYISSILLVVAAIIGSMYLTKNKKKPKPKNKKIVKTVFVETVKNRDIAVTIGTNGNLVAKNKIAIFSEVQGILKPSSRNFKAGTKFYKGEILANINSDEFYANYQAQKSNFINSLTGIMPDIRLDFPEQYKKWQAYLTRQEITKSLEKLPSFTTDKEKFFISGRNIITQYYNIKNIEVKLAKYKIRAPYTGILTEALVNTGTLVRPGQKLGEFINPSIFEMEVAIKTEFQNLLQVGKKVTLQNLEKTNKWTGKVVRINGKIDTKSQTVKAYIETKGKNLKEGEYLEVNLEAKTIKNAFEIPRNLLVNNSKVYIVKDSVLDIITVRPVFENKNSVVLKNIPNGTQLVSKPVASAHKGMKVKIYSNQN